MQSGLPDSRELGFDTDQRRGHTNTERPPGKRQELVLGPGGAQRPGRPHGRGRRRVDGQERGANAGQHILLDPEVDKGPVLPGRLGRDDDRMSHAVRQPRAGREVDEHGVRQPDQADEQPKLRRRVRIGGQTVVRVQRHSQENHVQRRCPPAQHWR